MIGGMRFEVRGMRDLVGIMDFSTYVHNIMCKCVYKTEKFLNLIIAVYKKVYNNKLYTTYTHKYKQCNSMINMVGR